MVRACELLVLFTAGIRSYSLDECGCSGFRAIGVVTCMEAVEDEHGGYHVLDAVVSVGEIVHRFVLFVDDADTGFVGADDNRLDVFGTFSLFLEGCVNLFGGFDGGLGMEFG